MSLLDAISAIVLAAEIDTALQDARHRACEARIALAHAEGELLAFERMALARRAVLAARERPGSPG